ncbi:DUF3883 domain-containing protein [Pedobacter sp. MC2016-24]|uniref:DUF3883 domain-containing protein n=1 Tax=Pedobacter sp. MC2016-24 TaxID=2780090 RepID=UPI00187F597C|nr:DUF3883 domain-containing protein [Pedobacter sp. MC2016-24]MBE9603140.1 DUF3883 domain-containing protein [Pedobacter sp. MC2016-24]
MALNNYRILVENEESAWNDETGIRYHFPKSRYFNRLKAGMKFIYYKGRTKSSAPSYFGYGEISSIYPDPNSATDYYADISKYIQFNESVDFKPGGEYLEEVRTSNHFRQNSVREISEARFYKILELGGLNLVKSSNEEVPIAVTELPPISEVNITLAPASLLKTAKAKVKGDQIGSSSLAYGNPKKALLHGNQGEYLVMKYLRSTLTEVEADTLRHHAIENEKDGYDISYTDLNGDPVYIEVKATSAPSFPSFIITINELTAAIKHGKAYKIYLVNKVTSKDVGIERIEDIARLLEAGEFVKNVVAFKIEKSTPSN